MALSETVVDAVSNSDFKTNAEIPTQSLASHATRLQVLAEKLLTKSLESIGSIQVTEGLGSAALNRSDLTKHMAEMMAANRLVKIVTS